MVSQVKYVVQGTILTILFFFTLLSIRFISSTVLYEDPANQPFFWGTSSLPETDLKRNTRGGQLFAVNCANCHALHKRLTGPALADVTSRWKNRKELYTWIHNPAAYMKKDKYTQTLYKEYGGVMMTSFPDLTVQDINAILDYTSAPVTDY